MAPARRRKKQRLSLTRRDAVRLGLVGLFAVVAGWLTIAAAGANLMRSANPDLALSFRSVDARAQAKRAENLLVRADGNAEVIASARSLAQSALERDPTAVVAWRSLAMAAGLEGNERTSTQLFHIAAYVSKRDLPTQLWLIEEQVRRDDIPGALGHYDTALRTSGASSDILLPVLVAATRDDVIIEPLAEVLRVNPPWRRLLFERLGGAPNADNLARLLELTAPSSPPEEKPLVAGLMRQMAERSQFGPASRVYGVLSGRQAAQAQAIRDGGFEQANPFPPFDWQLADDSNLVAEIRSVPGRPGKALYVSAGSGMGGTAARQLLVLRPGSYELKGLAGAETDGRPAQLRWRIVCGAEQPETLLDGSLPVGARPTAAQTRFRVPTQACPAQWLSIDLRADFSPGSVGGWVDSLSIQPVRP